MPDVLLTTSVASESTPWLPRKGFVTQLSPKVTGTPTYMCDLLFCLLRLLPYAFVVCVLMSTHVIHQLRCFVKQHDTCVKVCRCVKEQATQTNISTQHAHYLIGATPGAVGIVRFVWKYITLMLSMAWRTY